MCMSRELTCMEYWYIYIIITIFISCPVKLRVKKCNLVPRLPDHFNTHREPWDKATRSVHGWAIPVMRFTLHMNNE